MSLTKFELKKMLKSRVTVIAIAAVFALNLYMLLFGYQNPTYSGSAAHMPPFDSDITRRQQEGAYFAGEINDAWFQKFYAEIEAMRNDPANHISDEEKIRLRQEQFGHLTDEAFDEIGNFKFVKESFLLSHEYQKYEDMEFSAKFYEYANRNGIAFAERYRETYPGIKGETLAAKTEEMYGFMADGYTAYYNYDMGYEKLRIMLTTFPLTVGLLIIIALSPIFSAEYSGRTDALLLSSKHGKRKLIFAKLKAGLLFAVTAWTVIQIVNIILIFGIYGTTGAEAYWQNWVNVTAPFPWNQIQITIVTVATSFLGAVYLAGIAMLVSAFSKNQFVSLLISGIILLIPMVVTITSGEILNILPANILMSVVVWNGFDLAYLFGSAIPVQYVILPVAAVIDAICIAASHFKFKRRQVEN